MDYEIREWTPLDEASCRGGFNAAYQTLLDELPVDYRAVAAIVLQSVVSRAFTDMPEYFRDKQHLGAWVAESDGTLVGHIDSWFTDPVTAHIGNVFVLQQARRQGLASVLMDMAEQYGRNLGAEKITLGTGHPLVEAHAMYLKRGYRLTETVASKLRREIIYLKFETFL